jgi:alpha-amylase
VIDVLLLLLCRCATYQGEGGKWNKFGGRLAWDNTAICNNNPAWSGRGAHKTGDDYPAAPNIDHTQVGSCSAWP